MSLIISPTQRLHQNHQEHKLVFLSKPNGLITPLTRNVDNLGTIPFLKNSLR